tara:strand:- start:49 stop:300 length:252 start_codon:yes stop_codon:yes gene_type:complete
VEIVYLLVPVTLILVTIGVVVFSWAVKSGQYDDLEGPAHRILYDDDRDMIPEDAKTEAQKKAARPSKTAPEQSGQDKTNDNGQ